MVQMKKPEMEVIRFKERDLVVASNGRHIVTTSSIDLSGCSGHVPGDGTVTFNGVVYPISSYSDVSVFIEALRDSGISNAGVSTGGKPQSLRATLRTEADSGARNFYDGTYVYDPSATWTLGDDTYYGVFIRQ